MESKRYSDKLQFFHLKRNRQEAPEKPSLVFNTNSINSLITFVGNENIIMNETISKQKTKEPKPAEPDHDDTTDFSRFSSLIKSKQENEHFYYPNMNQAPEIDLPMDLPDLPGIANDISFSISEQELIVPSLARMNIVNDLPEVAELIEAETTKKAQEVKQPEAGRTVAPEVHDPAPPPVPLNIPPPPPPPIPASFVPAPPPIPAETKANQAPQKVPQANDDRSSLMQAIRNAGGKSKLRTVAAADEQPNFPTKKPTPAPAGNLMEDLHKKLAMRRRGIAGAKEAKKEKASIMEKVSSLIPPPTKRSESSDDSASSESGNDWD